MDYMDPMSSVLKKADLLNLSLSFLEKHNCITLILLALIIIISMSKK